METRTYVATCNECRHDYHFRASEEQIVAYHQGAHIQDCLPHVHVNIREIFITGTCGVCFDKMMGPEPD